MIKLLPIFLMAFALHAEDKPKDAPSQPPIEVRIALMQEQRDWLIADRQAHDKATALDEHAKSIAAQFHCVSWNPDFTCTFEAPKAELPKAVEKPKAPEKK